MCCAFAELIVLYELFFVRSEAMSFVFQPMLKYALVIQLVP